MKFSEIPELLPLLVEKPPAIAFTGVQCDSRRIRPGDLFVAISGQRDDGTKYGAAALAKGAAAVVSETPLRECPKTNVVVKDVRLALAVLANALNGWPSRKMEVFGITGTNGKTTTAWLLSELLRTGGWNPGLLTTVHAAYQNRVIPATRTTPDACELHALLAAMAGAGCDSAVMEVSSHALDQQRTAGIRFAGAAFTNLSHDHLDYHGSMEAYWETKKRLFLQLAHEKPGASAVCFLDAPYGSQMAEFLAALPVKRITCGFSATADIRAEEVSLTPDGSRFTLVTADGARVPLSVHLAGRHNIANLLCAVALALPAGVPLDAMGGVLQTIRPQWGRLERVPVDAAFRVFVDYAHTDDALTNVLSAIREMSKGRTVVVFGCGGDRDRVKRPLMGRACADGADVLVITSDNPRSEKPEDIITEIMAGIPQGTVVHAETDRRAAIRLALSLAKEEDVVLIAGKGHESFQEIAGRAFPFDDRLVVMEEIRRSR
ncbi:MAG: UDP-N-acetylmuramoyl-L-alanyl-D-glutamate--2,6-diaminopimelate ligase [Kiritimatiellaeota bacterium]|nr:UDP-N-acetylmuramoyl-L-alanyl-D-glutamate--2,6-diaminopimelate ligase [Kiritimatiellota bacterium]